ncbi:unnamed protein product [Hanseniaspora opuntiae]
MALDMTLINRFLHTRKIQKYIYPFLIGVLFLIIWTVVYLTSTASTDVDIKVSKAPEIILNDEVVSVEIDNTLTDNVFQDIISKISTMGPKVSLPFSQTFSEEGTTLELRDDSLGYYIKKCPNIGSNPEDWVDSLSYKTLQNSYLIVNDNVKDEIAKSHKNFVSYLRQNWEYPGHFYHGDGIVIGGGGKYSLQAYAVISVIRELKTTLPIEVLIPSSVAQDKPFCEMLTHKFDNVKCIYLQDIFDEDFLKTHEFHAFQYKSLALIASSFKNVLLLDADNFPLKNIDDIFDNELFDTNGMIVWPDFWRRTTHPFFYESAGIEIDLKQRVRNFYNSVNEKTENQKLPYHDFQGTLPDPSSETGEFLINKEKHWKSLILSLYYNVHGPNVFYHLFSQYAAGQGDKETFLAAAHILDLPYYQVFLKPSLDAYFEPKENARRSVAYYQKDYRKDHEYKLDDHSDMNDFLNNIKSETDSLFAHCNLPKFDVVQMTEKNDFTSEKDDKHFRAMHCKECLGDLDLERLITIAYYEEVCQKDQSKNAFKYLVHKDFDNICAYWKKRYELVKNTEISS